MAIKSSAAGEKATPSSEVPLINLPPSLTVQQLAERLGKSPIEIIKQLMRQGVMASINQTIDFSTAAQATVAFGFRVEAPRIREIKVKPRQVAPAGEDAKLLKPRPPVVTILGHVDHGKTTLLDAIRESNITASEPGEITQHIGAYQVEFRGQKITFLDTPGHEAFTAIRARGAQVTDIAVLVVAADDGVMPQTVEALDHAKAAEVPVIVALNKIDKPEANVERVKRQLADLSLAPEDWGGDTICVPISAKKKQGIDSLLENVLVVAELAELKANTQKPASGVVLEAKMDRTRGAIATLLVQQGTLKIGDSLVAGMTWGKVKAIRDDRGGRQKQGTPSTPLEVLGLNGVPRAGDLFTAVEGEEKARALAEKEQEQQERRGRGASLEGLVTQIRSGEVKELNIILKTDVQGSIEPIVSSLEKLETEKARARVLHAGSGSISESDILLAIASRGIILGFNARPEPGAKRLAEMEGVEIRAYDIIYHLIEDMQKALAGLLEPTEVEVIDGVAEVKEVFPVAKGGKVAGVLVSNGKAPRNSLARLLRKGKVVLETEVASLKRFKEDVREVATGYECGVGLKDFNDPQKGDTIQFYHKEKR